ncbi:MAG TPA: MFS transporter [Symbiobacteriaceae bacterium]|jgi:MFS family permease
MSLVRVTARVSDFWRGLGTSFWRIWTASTISAMGDGVRNTALPLLAAHLSQKPMAVSLITTAEYLPLLLFSLVSGVLADRYDRREIMWRVNLFRGIAMATFAVAVALGVVGIPPLACLAFILGSTWTLFSTAAQAILPSVVAGDNLERANSHLAVGGDISEQFIAPPLAGMLIVVLAWLPFGFDALTFLVAAALVYSVKGDFKFATPAPRGKGQLRKDIAEGMTWLWKHKLLRSLAIMVGAFSLFSKATLAIEVLYMLKVLRLHETGYGLLLASIAVGSVLGSFIAPAVSSRFGKAFSLYLAVASAVAACLGLGLTSTVVVAAPMFVLFGVSMTLWSVVAVTLRQTLIPKELMGRVNSAYRFISGGMAPVGAALGGVVAETFGLHAPYLVGAALLTGVAFFTLRHVTNRSLDAALAAKGS